MLLGSTVLTIAASAAIATGPALLGATRSFVSNLFFIICKGKYYNIGSRGKLSEKESV